MVDVFWTVVVEPFNIFVSIRHCFLHCLFQASPRKVFPLPGQEPKTWCFEHNAFSFDILNSDSQWKTFCWNNVSKTKECWLHQQDNAVRNKPTTCHLPDKRGKRPKMNHVPVIFCIKFPKPCVSLLREMVRTDWGKIHQHGYFDSYATDRLEAGSQAHFPSEC